MKFIPNALTLLNLLLGCYAISNCFTSNFHSLFTASYCIILATVLDFSDGFVARLLNATSDIGKQLDSLADLVTFGVAPSFIMYQIINFSLGENQSNYFLFLNCAFCIALASAYRLAKFNTLPSLPYFIGVPTPINALFIASIPFFFSEFYNTSYYNFLLNTNLWLAVVLMSALLLNLPLKMISLKFKTYSFAENKLQYIFIFLSLIALLLYKIIALAFIFFFYIFFSIIYHFSFKKQ
jgi:CDP-diacylglycerol---serine O-phosphatidyltransferase